MVAATPATGTLAPPRSDSAFEASALERGLGRGGRSRWIGWRRRTLVLAALLGCLAVFWLARWTAASPWLPATWGSDPSGQLVLQSSPWPELRAVRGQELRAIGVPGRSAQPVDARLLHHSPRWQPDDSARSSQLQQQQALAAALASGRVRLHLARGGEVDVAAEPRGFSGLGGWFWPLAALALLLYLAAMVVLLARPHLRNLLYALAALCQSANMLLIALEAVRGPSLPLLLLGVDPLLRVVLDAVTGAAIVHGFTLHPRRLVQGRTIAAATWAASGAALVALWQLQPSGLWWWSQGLCLALGATALAVIHRSCRLEPNPWAHVMRRFAALALATLLLVSAAVAITPRLPELPQGVAAGAAITWHLFLASLLLLTPFLARSRQVLREFALLAGISTVATSLDLLFVAVFSLGPFTSLAVAVFVALAIYAAARQLILNRMLGTSLLTTERTFEQLYRTARELQTRPQQFPQLLARLLAGLFEPLEVEPVDRVPSRSRVLGGGAALVVPIPGPDADDAASLPSALALRFAQRGQRLFTHDDARLADRVVEQLRRVVAYDQAVERGRHEERLRIAQDLHDDIGARLLTLMYRAESPETEDYIRHTLQDLKTLTRGLAASEHRLSHAAAEWKSDIAQRLTAAHVRLAWHCSYTLDLRLSVVQWSALTRVLRELVSNALYHGHASQIEVSLQFEGNRLLLRVADDGHGRDPAGWAHGLGLGGVRKRVKQLGGEVHWREQPVRGIVCEVQLPELGAAA